MTWQQVYWLTRLDSICMGLWIAMVLAFLFAGFVLLGSAMGECVKEWVRPATVATIIGAIALLLLVFIPSTKEAAAIYLIPKVVNNEHTKNIGDKGLKLLEAKFDEWLKDTMSEDKKDVGQGD